MSRDSIKEIAKSIGGVVALSRALGLSRGAVSQWTRVPIERVFEVEKITGTSRHKLRPDIFGSSPGASSGANPTQEAA